MHLKTLVQSAAQHLAANGLAYLSAVVLAANLFGPLAEFPNPIKIVACILLSWVPWALILAACVVAIMFAMRVVNSRSGADAIPMVVALGTAILVAIYATDTAKLQTLVTALGGGTMQFGTCTA